MPQRRGTWLPINKRFFVRIWCVVMAAEGSRASRWQQLSITQWHRTLHETRESSQTWDACQPARVPTRAAAVLFPIFSHEAASLKDKKAAAICHFGPRRHGRFSRRSHKGGSLPRQTIALPRASALRNPQGRDSGPWRPKPQPRGGVSRRAYSTTLAFLGLFGQARPQEPPPEGYELILPWCNS